MKIKIIIFILSVYILKINCDEETSTTVEAEANPSEEQTTSDLNSVTETPSEENNSKPIDSSKSKPSKAMLHLCCVIPHGYYVAAWQKCSKANLDNVEKITECYNNDIKLVVDGKINKDIVKRLYNLLKTAYTKHWTSYIEQAVDECEYEEKSNLTESLASFYSCINDKLAENCQSILTASYCNSVTDYFDDWRKPSCDVWSSGLPKVDTCCLKPVIFGSEYTANCRYECSKHFFTDTEISKCTNQCTDESQFFNDNDEYDKEKVKEMLKNSVENSKTWENVIDEGVEFCVEKVKADDNNTSHYHISHFISICLYNYFLDNCVEFDSKHACQRVKKFMAQCPKLKPSEFEHGSHLKDQRVYSSVQSHNA
ncbi:hypothetical protein PVAND_017195 [Polypedilum vanderplanki]|uniref:Uncharacterized protein n=1 Tax=Polypedilum vanderplanki TaxID=319348 RepID=A0A9J6BID6_POLVA|nr:hypothetical protein PVAND_017195 [Polypedilum vanderplanki]